MVGIFIFLMGIVVGMLILTTSTTNNRGTARLPIDGKNPTRRDKMKLIQVWGYGDYGAETFEKNVHEDRYSDLWKVANKADNNKTSIEIDVGGFKEEIYIKAYRFKSVDKEFINFVRNEVQDYDMAKHRNFYVVEEE